MDSSDILPALGILLAFFAALFGAYWLVYWTVGLAFDGLFAVIGKLFRLITGAKPDTLNAQERNDLLAETQGFINTPSLFTVACLAKFAKIDGVVTKNEISSIEAVFEYLGITGAHRQQAIAVFKHAKDGRATLRSYVEFHRELCANNRHWLRVLVFLMFLVAYSDGTPSQQTQQALVAVCGHLGFDFNEFFHEYKQAHSDIAKTDNSLDVAYATLGCVPTDALNVVRDRYRKLVKDFHPDTVMSKGLPAEFVKFAEERFKQIQAAYETVTQARETDRA